MKWDNLKISGWQGVLCAVSIVIFGSLFVGCRGSKFGSESASQIDTSAALDDSHDVGSEKNVDVDSRGVEGLSQESNETETEVTPLPNATKSYDVSGYSTSAHFAGRVSDRFQFQPVDEVWVIAESSEQIAQQAGNSRDDVQNIVSLLAPDRSDTPDPSKWVPLPINSFQISATVQDVYATVGARHSYNSPYNTPTEALFVFALPEHSVVDEFNLDVGGRAIRGIVRKREEAEQIYQEVRRQGYQASMMTQDRPNIFTHRIASIQPGEAIHVDLHYLHTLRRREGWKEMVFPKVFDPKYSGQNRNSDRVPDPGQSFQHSANSASHSTNGAVHASSDSETGEPREVIAEFSIELLPSVPWKEIVSSSHKIEVRSLENGRKKIVLKNAEELMERDFILRLKPKAEKLTTALTANRIGNETFLALSVYPPELGGKVDSSINTPLEMIFVLDCSDSMRGQPLEQAKKAIRFALEKLTENDSFQLIQFSNTFQAFGPNPLPGTRENIKRAMSYLERLEGVGGEQMTDGLSAALSFPHDEERLRFVCLMTDGRIGNEADILREIKPKIGAARIFSFGVGSFPNRFLLNRLALAGRGASAFLGYDDEPDVVMQNFLSYIRGAALTDLEIDWKVDQGIVDFYPSILPDVFRGRSVHVLARIQGEVSETIQLKGKLGGTDYSMDIETQVSSGDENPLKQFWAKARIADLSESILTAYSRERIELIASQIRETAIANHILSPLTTYEVVDSALLTAGDSGIEDSAPDAVAEDLTEETSEATK